MVSEDTPSRNSRYRNYGCNQQFVRKKSKRKNERKNHENTDVSEGRERRAPGTGASLFSLQKGPWSGTTGVPHWRKYPAGGCALKEAAAHEKPM